MTDSSEDSYSKILVASLTMIVNGLVNMKNSRYHVLRNFRFLPLQYKQHHDAFAIAVIEWLNETIKRIRACQSWDAIETLLQELQGCEPTPRPVVCTEKAKRKSTEGMSAVTNACLKLFHCSNILHEWSKDLCDGLHRVLSHPKAVYDGSIPFHCGEAINLHSLEHSAHGANREKSGCVVDLSISTTEPSGTSVRILEEISNSIADSLQNMKVLTSQLNELKLGISFPMSERHLGWNHEVQFGGSIARRGDGNVGERHTNGATMHSARVGSVTGLSIQKNHKGSSHVPHSIHVRPDEALKQGKWNRPFRGPTRTPSKGLMLDAQKASSSQNSHFTDFRIRRPSTATPRTAGSVARSTALLKFQEIYRHRKKTCSLSPERSSSADGPDAHRRLMIRNAIIQKMPIYTDHTSSLTNN